ncbi:MAG TPA: hypothetical protein VK874_09475, partial [Gaiellaceae bacterium]|nr:hypothetical protein [Gaiellaceae bacterium]
GRHTLELRPRPGPLSRASDGGPAPRVVVAEASAAQLLRVPAAAARSLGDRTLDWVEAVGRAR